MRSPPDRSLPLPTLGLPRQTIPLAGGADDALRILIHACTVVPGQGVFPLRLDVPAAHLNGIELVLAYTTEQDLVRSCLGIEAPGPVLLYDGNGQRPVGLTNQEGGRLAR